MRIKISDALDQLQNTPGIVKRFCAVRVEVTRHDDGAEELEWSLYAQNEKGKAKWSDAKPTFEDAVADLLNGGFVEGDSTAASSFVE